MTAPTPTVRTYQVAAKSTDVLGRVLCSARDHHFIVDGPVQNGCPGEALTPPELFLAAVASCGVELVEVIARDEGTRIGAVSLAVSGVVDRGRQQRTDVTVFNSVALDFAVRGADPATAARLVEGFRRR